MGRTCDWFTRTYPEAEFRFENAAIGGTGSMLGVYRLEHELLDKSDPDLVFVEFAVNDWSWPYDGIFSDMEWQLCVKYVHESQQQTLFLYIQLHCIPLSH